MSFDYKRMIKFEHNVGDKEKNYRIYAGAALIFISIFNASIALLLIGLVLVGTGFSGWCPVYSGLNKNTCTPADADNTTAMEATVAAVQAAATETVETAEDVASEAVSTVKAAASEAAESVKSVAAEAVETVKEVASEAVATAEAAAANVVAAVKGEDTDKPTDS